MPDAISELRYREVFNPHVCGLEDDPRRRMKFGDLRCLHGSGNGVRREVTTWTNGPTQTMEGVPRRTTELREVASHPAEMAAITT